MRKVFDIPVDLEQLARLSTYPGVSPEETRPLREFVKRYAARWFDQVRFDVRVGVGELAPDQPDQAKRRAVEEGTRMRVDALGWRAPNEATIIEAKVALENAGVWQLLGYRDAYVAEFPDHKVRLVMVAEDATATARNLCANSGIGLYLYRFPRNTIDIGAPAREDSSSGVQ